LSIMKIILNASISNNTKGYYLKKRKEHFAGMYLPAGHYQNNIKKFTRAKRSYSSVFLILHHFRPYVARARCSRLKNVHANHRERNYISTFEFEIRHPLFLSRWYARAKLYTPGRLICLDPTHVSRTCFIYGRPNVKSSENDAFTYSLDSTHF